MHDFENELYSALRTYVDDKIQGLAWTTVAEPVPVTLPTISVEVVSMPVDTEHIYGEIREFALPKVVIRASVRDNDKAQAKKLLACCDDYMASIGFIRSYGPGKESDGGAYSLYSIYDDNIVNIVTGTVYKR